VSSSNGHLLFIGHDARRLAMSASDELFEHLDIEKEIVLEFFFVFSRFEYALKRARYLDRDEGSASANWDKFASERENAFSPNETPELKEAVDYLDKHPPQKQVVKAGELSWQDSKRSESDHLLKWLLKLVKTVRNNLFHGGKFHRSVEDPSRNPTLLKNSLVILYACLELHPTVKELFLARTDIFEIPIEPVVAQFFVDFSRFEFALKRAEYVKPHSERNDAAEVDWLKFGQESHSDSFERLLQDEANSSLQQAVTFMRRDPPRKLVVIIGEEGSRQPCWKEPGPAGGTPLYELLVSVCRVRNNLFHGEKPETLMGGSYRGRELIEKSLEIIATCVSLDDEVKRAFESSTRLPFHGVTVICRSCSVIHRHRD